MTTADDVAWSGNTYRFAMSRGMALDYGLAEPTDDERAEAATSQIIRNIETNRQWDAVERETPLVLAMQGDPEQIVARAVLRMHDCAREPDTGVPRPWAKCLACTIDPDNEVEWPCETVQTVIAEVHGARLTDVPWSPRPPFGPVPNPLPWPRARFRDMFPVGTTRSFFIDYDPTAPRKPAPAPEPETLLAEVVDNHGHTWVRYHTDPTGADRHWWSNHGGGWRAYRDLDLPNQETP